MHSAAETGLHVKSDVLHVKSDVLQCTVWQHPQPQWEEERAEKRQTSHLLQFIKSKKEGFTQANKFKRQQLNSLPCLATPLALHLGSGPIMEKTEQIISSLCWFQ